MTARPSSPPAAGHRELSRRECRLRKRAREQIQHAAGRPTAAGLPSDEDCDDDDDDNDDDFRTAAADGPGSPAKWPLRRTFAKTAARNRSEHLSTAKSERNR